MMVENDQNNDEYKFEGLDSFDGEQMNQGSAEKAETTSYGSMISTERDVRKNALIVIAVVVALMVAYKFISYLRSGESPKPEIVKIEPKPMPPVIQEPKVNEVPDQQLAQKVNAVEQSTDAVKVQMNAVSDQMSNMAKTIADLNTEISKLHQTIDSLSSQVAKQNDQIDRITTRTQVKYKAAH